MVSCNISAQKRQTVQSSYVRREIGHSVRELQETTSTNRILMDMALSGAEHGTAVIADSQTAGRGKEDRIWFSKPGGSLCASVLLRLDMQVQDMSQVTLLAAVAMLDALSELGVQDAQLKWPNDILIGGRKICGILTEVLASDSGDPEFVVVGVGLNVSVTAKDFPAHLQSIATSLAEVVGSLPSRQHLFDTFLSFFETWLKRWRSHGFRPIAYAWCERSCSLGRWVEFETEIKAGVGETVGLGPDGSLLIREQGGGLHRFYSGEVRYIDVPPLKFSQMRSVS